MNKLILIAGVSAAVAGCSLAPKYERPAAPIPATLPTGDAYPSPTTAATTQAAVDTPWQEFFTDPRLRHVIALALDNSRDLRLAALNVERARALYGVQRAELLPAVNAGAGMHKQRVPADLSSRGEATYPEQYSVNLGIASWELDLFGRIRSLSRAAQEQFFATQEARRGAQISIMSSVASSWLLLAADRENLALSRTTLESQQGAYDLVKRRFELGVAGEVDVYRAQTQVDAARGDMARFSQLVAQDLNLLNQLVGTQVPAELLPADLAAVAPPAPLAAGVSSEVLLRRPDIMQAEHQLRAATANIGAARAAFFPRISLTGTVGTASGELSGLFSDGSGTWSFSPQISMPIFDPRVWSAARVTDVDRKIATTQYERVIQASFRDVADALAVQGTVDQQVEAQESFVNAVAATYRLAGVRYERGVDSYLSVLDAQRSLYSAQQNLVRLRYMRIANQVRLYAVLGGGWLSSQPTTQPSAE
jgi:multidrug efflux system outer membrane protein